MNVLRRVWWVLIDVLRPRRAYATEIVKEFPDRLEPKCIYLVGDASVPWFAALLCPCGCGAFIRLSLLNNDRPQWRARRHFTGTVTLEPSIWRKTGCRSHFLVRRGRIVWAQDSFATGSAGRSGISTGPDVG